MINLEEKKEEIIETATFWFRTLMDLSNDIRKDVKDRTGISVYIREPGKRNSLHFSIGEPSTDAQDFAVEKAVRSYVLGHVSSQNSEDPEKLQFAGSLTLEIDGTIIQVSVSGLQAFEDVFMAIQILSRISGTYTYSVCLRIAEEGGELPKFNHWYENQLLQS
ncbi:MAG: hypothetical protein WAW11_01190 [Patescibacteria group bacterium]